MRRLSKRIPQIRRYLLLELCASIIARSKWLSCLLEKRAPVLTFWGTPDKEGEVQKWHIASCAQRTKMSTAAVSKWLEDISTQISVGAPQGSKSNTVAGQRMTIEHIIQPAPPAPGAQRKYSLKGPSYWSADQFSKQQLSSATFALSDFLLSSPIVCVCFRCSTAFPPLNGERCTSLDRKNHFPKCRYGSKL